VVKQKELMDELFCNEKCAFHSTVAGWTFESYIKISETLGNKIKALKLA
jgi:hypothetical protein